MEKSRNIKERARNKEYLYILRVKNDKILDERIEEGFNSVGKLKLDSNSIVAIKPNLCTIKSCDTGTTTDPRVIRGIIKYLKKSYSINNFYIMESDGGQVLADMAFKLLGYEKIANELGVKLVNLSKMPFTRKDYPKNVYIKKIRYPIIMEEVDFFITVPKIKTHGKMFTSALKNQYGCNPNPNKDQYHKRLDDAIVDLNYIFKPDLVVVDGLIAMGGFRGPSDGIPIKMNTLIIGKDVVAVDHLVARIMGINPRNVKYFVEAERRGLGTTKYDAIGEIPWEFKERFCINPPKMRNFYNLFYNYK